MIDPSNPDYSNTPALASRPAYGYVPVDPSAPPAVTIVTPFYNTGPIFHETARSVLLQSFQQWEWMIVNDGSTDPESLAILEQYRHLDPRIRIIEHDSNKGLSAARNAGYQAANTPYVLQLDSDDLLEPTALEKWLWFLESFPEYGFVKGYSVGFGAQEYLWRQGFHDKARFLERNLVDPTCLVRRDVHHRIGGYDETIREGLEDWDFWLRCAHFGYWGTTMPEYLDWYRRRPRHTDRWTNWDDGRREQAFKEKLRRRYPQLWKKGFPRYRPQKPGASDSALLPPPFHNSLEKRKPRILLILPWLTLGGADQFNLQVLQQLVRREWEVTIATTLWGEHIRHAEFASHTPDVFILHHFLHPSHYPRFLLYLLRSRQPDVVMVSHSEVGYDLLPYLRRQYPQAAYVDYCHIEEVHWRNGGYPRMAVEKQSSLDLSFVSSEHLKQWMVDEGGDSERIRICYTNGDPASRDPDGERRATVRRQLDVKDSVPVILFAGRICPQKQPRVFTATLLKLREMRTDFVAIAAGDGPDMRWLKSFIRRHRLSDQVRLLGAVSQPRVRELMLAADIFFLPSAWEGIALTMYEAMACGLPIVGADVGGQREVVTPECGILLRHGHDRLEPDQYARALDHLLSHPELRRAMGEAGRNRVEMNFRLDQMGDRMESLLREAQWMRTARPRPAVSEEAGAGCAKQVIELLCVQARLGRLWWDEYQPVRVRTFFALRRLLRPMYREMVARELQWATPLKDRLKLALLGWS